jgi:predicted nucleotidyltransferase
MRKESCNAIEIAEKLKEKKYDFLWTTEGLGDNIILLTTGGSHAYGTNVSSSDIDLRGISLNTRKEILTMNCRIKPFEDRDTDTVIYTLKHITSLLTEANPNTLEILGTRGEHLFVISEQGKLMRENVDLFLSKKAIQSFGEYAAAQLRRLQNALARDSYSQAKREEHILSSLMKRMKSFADKYKHIENGSIKLYIDKSSREGYEKEIFMDISLNHYPLRDFKVYSEMNDIVRNFEKLNHRNKKKDEMHLNKHAMHLIRLLIMGTEILEGKGVNTYREKDKDFLLKIRNGDYVTEKNGHKDYSLVFEIVDVYEKKFKYAAENTSLPDQPDCDAIDALVEAINLSVL